MSPKTTLNAYNSTAKAWSEKHSNNNFWNEEYKTFNSFLPKGKILEIGAGGGRDAKILIEMGYEYTGTDISKNFIEVAQEKNPNTTFLVQSVYDLNFPKNTFFDGFWASASLLHIPKSKIDSALQQIKKYIRIEGIGFISLKKGEGENMDEQTFEEKPFNRIFAYYSESEFTEILHRNGFELLQFIENKMTKKTTWLCFFVRLSK